MEPSTTQVAISYWYVSPASVEAKPSFPPYLLCVWDDDGVKKAQGLGARLTPLWSQAPRPPIPCSIPAAKPSFWVTPPSKEQPLIMSAFERPAPAEPVWFWPTETWPTTPGWVIEEEDAAKKSEPVPPAKPSPKRVVISVWLKSGQVAVWTAPCPSGDPMNVFLSTGWLNDMETVISVPGEVAWGSFRKEDVAGLSVDWFAGEEKGKDA